MLAETTKTERGFELVEFTDANGVACSLQQSSAIADSCDKMPRPGTRLMDFQGHQHERD